MRSRWSRTWLPYAAATVTAMIPATVHQVPRSGEDEAETDHQDEADRPEEDGGQYRPHGGGQRRRRGQEAAEGHLRRGGIGQAGDHYGQNDRRQPDKPPTGRSADGASAVRTRSRFPQYPCNKGKAL
ncbi:hypothetical protein GCM10020254_78950 [Streptomyces goshikiensis]